MKCLEKDRGRRFETASALAMDLDRHLKSEPVLACPPSAIYRARKFARRNRAGLAIASVLGLAVLFAVVELAISIQVVTREKDKKEAALARAVQEKERADRNLSRARQAVKDYLLKTSENPLLQSGDFQALRQELLETAIPFYEEFVRQDRQDPDLELERGLAHDDLGFLRQELGDQEHAVEDFEAGQRIFGKLSASFPDHPLYRLRLVESHNNRASALDHLGRLDAAEAEYRQALTLVERLIAEHGVASERLESLARVQGNLGVLLQESGRLPDAEPLLRQTVATREMLLERQPDSLPLRGQLAHSWNNLGVLLRAQRQPADAERAFEKVLEILDSEALGRLGKSASEPTQYLRLQQQRARAWNNLGVMRNQTDRFPDAEKAFREAIAIKQTLADRFPSVPQYRRDLAASLNNLGIALMVAKRSDEAHSAYQKAIQLYERLSVDSPGGVLHAVELAGTYSNVGRLIVDQGQPEQSLPWLAKSVDSLEDAFRRDERVAKVRESLCVAHWTRAITLAKLERFSEALTDWDRAVEIDDGRYRQQLRLQRASNLLRLKDYGRATADAAALSDAANATAEEIYNAACVYALAAQLARPADAPAADSHAREAVRLLRRAVAKGFKDRAHLEADPDLEALRSHEDFRKLVEELAGGSNRPQDGKRD
jgi:tetratricopeptide (TPR) repeat protein